MAIDGNTEEVGVRLVVDGQAVWSSNFQKAKQSVKDLGDEARKQQVQVKGIGSELDKAANDIDNFGKKAKSAFSDASSAVGNFISPLRTGISTATSLMSSLILPVGVVTAGLTAAAGAATYFGLKTYSGLQQANAAFTTFLGSQQASTAYMAQLKQFAMTTPFDFQNLVPAAQRLLNTGDTTTQSLQDLTAIGDVAAGADPMEGQAGVNRISLAISQIKQSQSVHAQDLNQLIQAGINPYVLLGKATGKSAGQIQQDVQGGKVPGAQAAQVLMGQFEKQYGGLMQRENATLAGQLSNLHDTIAFQLADATTPLAQLLTRNLPTITTDLTKLATLFGHTLNVVITDGQVLWGSFQSGGMNGMLKTLGDLTGTGSTFVTVWGHIKTDSHELADIWEHSLYPSIQDVNSILGPLALGSLTTIEDILKWMDEHPDAARAIFDGIGISYAAYKWVSLVSDLTGAFGKMITQFPALVAGFTTSGDAAQVAAAKYGEADATSSAFSAGAGAKYATAATLGALGPYEAYKGASSKKANGTSFLQLTGGTAATGAALGLLGGPFAELSVPVGAAGGAAVGALGFGIKKLVGQASGGQTISSGWSMIGEKGPEAMWMPKSATVVPLDEAKGMGSAYQQVNFNEGAIQINGVDMDSDQLANTLITAIQSKIARQ